MHSYRRPKQQGTCGGDDHWSIQSISGSPGGKRQVCKGYAPELVANILRDRGHLIHEKGRLTTRQRIPGFTASEKDKVAVYLIKPSIFRDDFEDL